MIIVKVILLLVAILTLLAAYNLPKNSKDHADKLSENSYNFFGHLYLKKYLHVSVGCFVLLFLMSKSEEGSSKKSTKINYNETYTFYDGQNSRLECLECDPVWCIQFIDEGKAELWTRPLNNISMKSCLSTVNYIYDETTQTITIIDNSNNNVSSGCLSKFIGEWQWKSGQFGERFYSEKFSDCDFS